MKIALCGQTKLFPEGEEIKMLTEIFFYDPLKGGENGYF